VVFFKTQRLKAAQSDAAERLPDRSGKPAEAMCDGFVADLQRIAATTVSSTSQRRQPIT